MATKDYKIKYTYSSREEIREKKNILYKHLSIVNLEKISQIR